MADVRAEPPIVISVVIPAYNAEKYIARAVESVLKQTRRADEIIVIDDGSTDGTADAVRSFGDRVRLIQQPNAGVSAARNAGIRAAAGNWIAFLDADDEWLPEKLELQTSNLARNPHVAWTTGNYIECLCDEGRTAVRTPEPTCIKRLNGKDAFDSYFEAFEKDVWGHTDCMLIRKDVFEEIGLFRTDLCIAEDIDMWLRIAYQFPQVGFLCQPIAIYHLAVSNSLMVSQKQAGLYAKFMQCHFELAGQAGCLDAFVPAASVIMRRWIRGLLFRGNTKEICGLLNAYPQAFSGVYRLGVRLLMLFPSTRSMLRFASRVIRKLKLRRRLTRSPK